MLRKYHPLLQTKLAELYRKQKTYPPAIEIIDGLIKEVKNTALSFFGSSSHENARSDCR